jgi:SAM-dependent methyltransferase
LRERVDFVYAFDVFVHFDLHATWSYIQLIHQMLRPGGRAMVHVANIAAPLGWEQFSRQKGFSVGGLYWLCPEVVAVLADHGGFSIIADSTPNSENEYLSRDYVAVLERS